MAVNEIRDRISHALEELYQTDAVLFIKNDGNGVAERCLAFRLAHYLQLNFPDYSVDCDYNSSYVEGRSESGKMIRMPHGQQVKRYIDIIIHRRNHNQNSDFLCFEIKKWNNKTSKGMGKDRNNLDILTSEYGYRKGFHIILGKTLSETTLEIFNHDTDRTQLNWDEFNNE